MKQNSKYFIFLVLCSLFIGQPLLGSINDFKFKPSFVMQMRQQDAKTASAISSTNRSIMDLIQKIRNIRKETDRNPSLFQQGQQIESLLAKMSEIQNLKKIAYIHKVEYVSEAENRRLLINKLNKTLDQIASDLFLHNQDFLNMLDLAYKPGSKTQQDSLAFKEGLDKILSKYKDE